jgi:hypothetical protein
MDHGGSWIAWHHRLSQVTGTLICQHFRDQSSLLEMAKELLKVAEEMEASANAQSERQANDIDSDA